MKKVLFVSYYYPPMGGVGAQRVLRFIKYLPEFGWEPYVLTAEPSPYLPYDEAPIGILQEERVRRAEVLEPLNLLNRFSFLKKKNLSKKTVEQGQPVKNPKNLKEGFREIPLSWKGKLRAWLFVPDDRIGWIPEGTREGLGFVLKEKFDCLISTSAPYTAHLLAWRIKKRTGIPWIADFRDLWSTNTFIYFPTKFHKSLNSWLEKLVVQTADYVMTCTPLFREDFLLRYHGLPADKFAMITNGFDPADFPLPHPDPYPRFTISYVGDFYGPQTPVYFLLGLRAFLNKNSEAAENIQVLFVGPFENRVSPIVDSLDLGKTVRFLGFLPHEQSVAIMRRSHLLLLVLGSKAGGEKIYPAKVFEYLAAQKPILALVPDGITKELLKESGVAFIVNPENEDAVAIALDKIYRAYKENGLPLNVEPANLQNFNARELTKNLAQLMDNIQRTAKSIERSKR
ncbi:MAG: glycosyltransferase family 4 protein [Caldiserica bacterium]|jgi:glycosyltransferase involved in cell wall biosynthesis|nr:glycosyltransferase family 4 protein [Caldisericota bacterium]